MASDKEKLFGIGYGLGCLTPFICGLLLFVALHSGSSTPSQTQTTEPTPIAGPAQPNAAPQTPSQQCRAGDLTGSVGDVKDLDGTKVKCSVLPNGSAGWMVDP